MAFKGPLQSEILHDLMILCPPYSHSPNTYFCSLRRWRRGCHPPGSAGAGDGGHLCPGTGFPESRGRWEGTAGDSATSLGTSWQGTDSPSSVTGQLTGVIRAGGSHPGQEKGTRGTSSPRCVIPIPNRPGCSSSGGAATEDAPGKVGTCVRG